MIMIFQLLLSLSKQRKAPGTVATKAKFYVTCRATLICTRGGGDYSTDA